MEDTAMTSSLIAEIKDGAQCALRSDAHPYHARRVIELCEEIDRLQRELAEARERISELLDSQNECK
jgi:hypothetical protein